MSATANRTAKAARMATTLVAMARETDPDTTTAEAHQAALRLVDQHLGGVGSPAWAQVARLAGTNPPHSADTIDAVRAILQVGANA